MIAEQPRHLLIIGGGGLLGGALASIARSTAQGPGTVTTPSIRWGSANTTADLDEAIDRFRDRVGDDRWAIAWCAGAGIIGSDPEDLAAETRTLEHLLGLASNMRPGVVLLSSSAGGVFGKTRSRPITELSAPLPISDYGENKLRQEQIVADWACQTDGQAAIARISNLYGPGQSLAKPQGLISHLALSVVRRQPVGIYVSLDTIRDYVYVDDAALQLLELIDFAETLQPGAAHTKIVASMRSISIGGILNEMRRVARRDPTVIMARSPLAGSQGSTLSFKSVVEPNLERCVRTTLPAGIDRVVADLRRRNAQGTLDA